MTFDEFQGLANQTSANGNLIYQYCLYVQASLETGHFRSKAYLEGNNMFAMGLSSKRTRYWSGSRPTTDDVGQLATYESRLYSLLDRIDLDDFNGVARPQTPEGIESYFYKVKQKGYATDPEYVQKLMNLANQLSTSDMINNPFGDSAGGIIPEDEESPSLNLGGALKLGLPLLIGLGIAVWYFFFRKK